MSLQLSFIDIRNENNLLRAWITTLHQRSRLPELCKLQMTIYLNKAKPIWDSVSAQHGEIHFKPKNYNNCCLLLAVTRPLDVIYVVSQLAYCLIITAAKTKLTWYNSEGFSCDGGRGGSPGKPRVCEQLKTPLSAYWK